jgi:citrate/tricarballylate utilization protein
VLELEVLNDAERQLNICNACRYCEGVCAVFPALERRSFIAEGDVTYLASLCHDCRDCYEVCPYAPPHELAIDIPRLMSSVREQTYRHYGWPQWLARRVDRRLSASLAFALLAVAFVIAATIVGSGVDRLFGTHTGPGSFYEVVPWLAMMLPAMAISLFGIAVMLQAGVRFWRDTDMTAGPLRDIRSFLQATWDAATLRYLRGGGPGCTYPNERPSYARLVYHSLVFYGFASAFASTVLAAIYQDIFGILPPYPLLSLPVVLGTIGGIAMIIGCIGLLAVKAKADPERSVRKLRTMDVAFIVVLLLVNVSGMLTLALRETFLLGITLNVHLGFTAALFVTLPYGKFVHSLYRYLALVRHAVESRREQVG